MSSKRILIMTASIGSGHIKAAEAVAAELRRQQPDVQLQIVDFMSRETAVLHWLMKEIYLVMLALIPNIYDVFYRASGGESGGTIVQQAFAWVMLPVMRRLVARWHPDAIVCTHPFPEGAAALLKRRTGAYFQLSAVMTDYSLHQIWLYAGVDQYFMALPSMAAAMERRGFAAEQLFVTGIPVDPDLAALPAQSVLRQQLGLPLGQAVVLLMGGGLGLGGIDKTLQELEALPGPLTLLVVAGRNQRLCARVQAFAKRSVHTVRVWGYTEQAHALMRASDLIITKPGALTMSEAFVLGVPLLLHDPIPGPETENAVYATRHGAAVWLHPGERIAPAVQEMLSTARLQPMRDHALACACPQAARQIAQRVLMALSTTGKM